jgi:hypothetical protein
VTTIDHKPATVVTAFDLLRTEIETEIDLASEVSQDAIRRRDYVGAEEAIERAKRLAGVRDKIDALRREYHGIFAPPLPIPKNDVKIPSPLLRGRPTPREAYIRPILQALQDRGGEGKTREVLDDVLKTMQDTLTAADYELLPADDMPRWSKNARWMYHVMRNELRYVRNDSPWGYWQIAERGIQYLQSRGRG